MEYQENDQYDSGNTFYLQRKYIGTQLEEENISTLDRNSINMLFGTINILGEL